MKITDIERVSERDRRQRYLENQIRIGLRFQMRALRKDRGLTQKQLAKLIGSQQTVISRVENHNADRLSIPTLLKIARAFDVGVVVRFEPIDQLVNWYEGLTPEKLSPPTSESILEGIKKQLQQKAKSKRPKALSIADRSTATFSEPFTTKTDAPLRVVEPKAGGQLSLAFTTRPSLKAVPSINTDVAKLAEEPLAETEFESTEYLYQVKKAG